MNTLIARIDYALNVRGMTAAALSRSLSNGRSSLIVSDMRNGKSPYNKLESLQRIAKILNCSLGWLASGEGNIEVGGREIQPANANPIAVFDMGVSASYEDYFRKSPDFYQYYETKYLRRLTNAPPSKLSIVYVDGDSMNPTFARGDQVMIDHTQTGPKEGIYVVSIEDMIYVKRLVFHKKSLHIISDNKAYPERVYDLEQDAIQVIGQVIGTFKQISS